MEKESLIKRYLVFILGLYFLAMGIVLIVHSALGTTPHFQYQLRVESEYSAYLGNMDIYHQYADGTDSALAYPGWVRYA